MTLSLIMGTSEHKSSKTCVGEDSQSGDMHSMVGALHVRVLYDMLESN